MVDQKMLTDLPNQGQFIHDPVSREIPNSNSTMGCGHIFKEGSVIHVRKRIAGESLTKRTKYGVSRQGLCVCVSHPKILKTRWAFQRQSQVDCIPAMKP